MLCFKSLPPLFRASPLVSRCVKQLRIVSRLQEYSQFVERKVKLSYDVYSSKCSHLDLSPIVVLHGLCGNKSEWKDVCTELNNLTGRKVIACDAVNHGTSWRHESMNYRDMTLDLLILLEKLKINKVSCIGHRMGGKTVMTLALTQPEKIDKFVVIDVSPATNKTVMGDVWQYLRLMKDIDLKVFKTKQDVYNHLETLDLDLYFQQSVLSNIDESVAGMDWTVCFSALLNNYDEIISFPCFLDPVCCERPCLFLTGDNGVLKKDADVIYKRFPNSSLKFMTDTTPWVHKERQEDLLQAFHGFFKA